MIISIPSYISKCLTIILNILGKCFSLEYFILNLYAVFTYAHVCLVDGSELGLQVCLEARFCTYIL